MPLISRSRDGAVPGGDERGAGGALVLGVDVDRGEHAVGTPCRAAATGPLTPVPVPISTTARAADGGGEEAQRRRPHPGPTGTQPSTLGGGTRGEPARRPRRAVGRRRESRGVRAGPVDRLCAAGPHAARRVTGPALSQAPLRRFSPIVHGYQAPYVTIGRGRRPVQGREHQVRPSLPQGHDPPQEVRPHDDRQAQPRRLPCRPSRAARRRRRVDPAELGRCRPRARRPGLPPGLPAHRQPARRRGPHPGDVRPGVPLARLLQARHVRGLAAPDHHEPVPRHGAPPRADPHGGAARGLRPATAGSGPEPEQVFSDTHLDPHAAGRARRAAARSSGPRSCSATSKVCRTRRSAPRSA